MAGLCLQTCFKILDGSIATFFRVVAVVIAVVVSIQAPKLFEQCIPVYHEIRSH